MTSLTVLRKKHEENRFERLKRNDSRTAIPMLDAEALAAELKPRIDGEVRFDRGTRALYATDGSNYRQVPIGVVVPRHAQDAMATVELARKYGAPILSRGGGTSLAGQCCNVAVVMDFSKYMHGIIGIDPARKLATVQPGCVLDDLRNTAAEKYGLMYAPDPETHDHCTLGGMLGNNSCGVHSLMSKTMVWACAPVITRPRWRSSPTTAPASASARRRRTNWSESSAPVAVEARSTPK